MFYLFNNASVSNLLCLFWLFCKDADKERLISFGETMAVLFPVTLEEKLQLSKVSVLILDKSKLWIDECRFEF